PFFVLSPSPLASMALHSFPTRRSSDLVWDQCLPAAAGPPDVRVDARGLRVRRGGGGSLGGPGGAWRPLRRLRAVRRRAPEPIARSEEHTSELQSRVDLVCRLLLDKKNK